MISFEHFTMTDGIPIYQQIVTYIKRGVVTGTVVDGDELPSRRVLSALLGVNPNTVQKAYKLLEEDGLISSHTGAKSVMALDTATVERIRTELIQTDARGVVHTLRSLGITKEEAIRLLEAYWYEEGDIR